VLICVAGFSETDKSAPHFTPVTITNLILKFLIHFNDFFCFEWNDPNLKRKKTNPVTL